MTEWCKKEQCWDYVRALALDLPAELPPEMQSAPGGDAGSTGKPSEPVSHEDLENMDRCRQVDGATWLKIHAWGTRTGLLKSWQAGIAHTLAGYAANSWSHPPSPKQARQGVQILDLAAEHGELEKNHLGSIAGVTQNSQRLAAGNLYSVDHCASSSRRSKELHEPRGEIGIHLTLPENENIPSRGHKLLLVLPIAFDVSSEFFLPEFSARLRHIRVAAVVAMPKAPVDKYHSSSRRKCDIGTAGQVLDVQSVSIAKAMQQAPDRKFGTGVGPADAPLMRGTTFRGHYVC